MARLALSEGRVKFQTKDGALLVISASGSAFLTISAEGRSLRQLSRFAISSKGQAADRLAEVALT